jgi:CRISPR type III-A-associated RAMP protein Csm4/CRISPR type III-A-associated RAMP protein Csm3
MPEASTTSLDFPFFGKVILTGILTTRTGLHVGAGGAGINPRGVDAPLIRDPMSRRPDPATDKTTEALPYIPGSSLRGKLRMLLVRKLGKSVEEVARAGGKPIHLHSCPEEKCEVCRLFGSVPQRKPGQGDDPWSLPAALHLTDLRLTEEARARFQRELKSENALDRITAHSNPRQIERIPRDTSFAFSFTYYVRRLDFVEEDLRNLLATLALLQDDTLGGHGSRGYGAVTVSLKKIQAQRFGLHEPAVQPREYPLPNLALEEVYKQIAQTLPEIKALLTSLPPVTSAEREVTQASDEEDLYVARLQFASPLHVGEPQVGLEGCVDMVSSDTLFSALANAWVTLYGKQSLQELLATFNRATTEHAASPPFLISSAFPYLGEEFFFPKPFTQRAHVDEEQLKNVKLKDIKFLPSLLFNQWIAGQLETETFEKSLKEEEEKRSKRKLSTKEILPRLRLDRLDLASNLYFCGQVYFPEDGGLYFLVKGQEKVLAQLHEALQLLGELGLGGERSLGLGRFTVRDWKKIHEGHGLHFLVKKTISDAFLTLSLFHPNQSERELWGKRHGEALVGYQLVERGGWVDSPMLRSPLRKKTCRLFSEGSVFQTERGEPRGCLIDVTPEPVNEAPHHIYRYGFAFPVKTVLPRSSR